MRCEACGSDLSTVERQLRAADEATQTVTSCPSCPVKPWLIDTLSTPKEPRQAFRIPVRRALPQERWHPQSCDRCRYVVSIDMQDKSPLASIELRQRHIVVFDHLSHNRSLSEGSTHVRAETTVAGPQIGERSVLVESVTLGLGAWLHTFRVQRSDVQMLSGKRVLVGHYAALKQEGSHESIVYRTSGSARSIILTDIGFVYDSKTVNGIMDRFYFSHDLPAKLSNYMQPEYLSRLGSLSARAWDTSRAPAVGYTFTSKPDGERMWLVFYGKCWYGVLKSRGGSIVKWLAAAAEPSVGERAIVLDVEHVAGFGFLLIDCLTTSSGDVAPISRDLAWVTDAFSNVKKLHPSCPVTLRQYFRAYGDAVQYTLECAYPTDGVVAIRDGSTEILKVKDVKSIELEHRGDGEMYTSDGTKVLELHGCSEFDIGSIVEIRFAPTPSGDGFALYDSFIRIDKATANSTEAALNIFRSTTTTATRDDDERRRALLWCNKLRELILKRSLAANDTKHIVLDVGSGTGQSLDSMSKSDSVSYILLEPNPTRCEQLRRRLGSARYITDVARVVPLIKQLKTRSVSHLIVNCTLAELTSAVGVMDRLVPELKCIVATFSIQYVVDDIYDILDVYDVPVYGCCYTYDSASDDGVLIDVLGVHMKMIDNENASVKWGRDAEYTEPVVYSRDIQGAGTAILGSDLLALPEADDASGSRLICSKVTVVLPRT